MSTIADMRRFHAEMVRRATIKARVAQAQTLLRHGEDSGGIQMFFLTPAEAREKAGFIIPPPDLPKRH